MNKTARRFQGFTLIELLVVIGIIVILAAILVLAINPAEIQKRGRDANRISDIATLRRAIDLSITDGELLTADQAGDSAGGVDASNVVANYLDMDVSRYLSVLPQDPSYIAASTDSVNTANGDGTTTARTKADMVYEFIVDANGAYYELNSFLESNDNDGQLTGDGGNADTLYESGTDPGLDLL